MFKHPKILGCPSGATARIPAWIQGGVLLALVLLCAEMPAAHAQATPLTATDISTTTGHASPDQLTTFGSRVCFTADDAVHGIELWISDGTANETYLVKDINPGIGASMPRTFAVVGSEMLFVASDGTLGEELWVTDGTPSGTRLVKDIMPGALSSGINQIVVMDGKAYFGADDGTNGRQLWFSDGTSAGTGMVGPLGWKAGSSTPCCLLPVGTTLYFVGATADEGAELWKTDGTANGTVMVKDIFLTGDGVLYSPTGQSIQLANGLVYFCGQNPAGTFYLWRSDGTADGTIPLKPFLGGSLDAKYYPLEFNGKFYFFAPTLSEGTELWVSDGTSAGTELVKDIRPGSASSIVNSSFMVSLGSCFVFFADDGVSGQEPWVSDGTADGTMLLKDLTPGSGGSANGLLGYCMFNGQFLFMPWVPTYTRTFYTTDGTADGTDIFMVPAVALGQKLAIAGGKMFFVGVKQTTLTELYVSNGTADGTEIVRDINDKKLGIRVEALADVNNTLFLSHGPTVNYEIWRSNGTVATTYQVKDINPSGSSTPNEIVNLGGKAYFDALDPTWGRELFRSDGTSGGTYLVSDINSSSSSAPINLTVMGSDVFFVAYETSTGKELWKSNGTGIGTVLVKDIVPGTSYNPIENLTAANNLLFFTARTSATGTELWKSDGTSGGTAIVKDLAAGAASSSPGQLTKVGSALFFVANDGSGIGEELWKSDGTDGGTVLVKDIESGVLSSAPRNLLDVGGTVWFSAYDSAHGVELWLSDGTEAGTRLVKDICPGPESSNIGSMTALDGVVYFAADDGSTGLELWRSDGTEEGTYLLKDIEAGAGSSAPQGLTAVPGASLIVFTAESGNTGFELYVSNGTPTGTWLVLDICPGSFSSHPSLFTVSGGNIFFAANHQTDGRQLWVLDPDDLRAASLGDLVFDDQDNDGVFEPGEGESGIDGVLVNLYSDTGSTLGVLDAGDTYLTSQVSAGGGAYVFTGLVNGDYIVQIDPSNFETAGALEGFVDGTGNEPAPDPDDDVDNDDNGSADAFGGFASQAVSITAGSEPATGVDSDDANGNRTVDFGFVLLPVAEILGSDPMYVAENELVGFEGAGTDSKDGTNVTYDWDWDDGSPNGSAQNPIHVWDAPGTYTVTLVVTDPNGLSSSAVTVQVVVLPKAGERDLFLKRGKFAINWKAHADGLEKDTFFVQGCLNPAGCNADLTDAAFELGVNGVSLGAIPLASTGKGSAGDAKVSLKAKTGAFTFSLKNADLRAALGLDNADEAGSVELAVEITVTGAGLDTETFAAHAAFAYATTQDVSSKGSFNYKLNASSDGYFLALKTSVSEDKAGAHKVSVKGYVEAPGGASLAPAGDVTLEIGAQSITIPATSLTVSGGVIALNKDAHPDLAKFVLDTNKKQFAIQTNALSGTGVPAAGVAVTSHNLLLRVTVPTADDTIVLETSVEILRSSPTSKKWKR